MAFDAGVCQICHGEQVKSAADLPKIREFTSAKDYDGDGKTDEPILGEITGLQESLLKSIQAYAKEVAGAEIKYDPDVYPYFSGADGKPYVNWTPRLLKAAYNYQFSIKDTGQYAHGPKYVIQLLYDSIEDLNAAEGLKTKTDQSKMNRVDYGHFDGTSMAFRDWDADGEVPASCAKCHSAGGLPQIFANPGATISTSSTNKALSSLAQPISNGLMCGTCHDEEAGFPARFFSASVKFPSGKSAWFANADGNLCLNCHQGRQSKNSVDAAIVAAGADKAVDKISVDKDNKPNLSFSNPHYFAAGATLLGTEVQGGYEYDEQKYSGAQCILQYPLLPASIAPTATTHTRWSWTPRAAAPAMLAPRASKKSASQVILSITMEMATPPKGLQVKSKACRKPCGRRSAPTPRTLLRAPLSMMPTPTLTS